MELQKTDDKQIPIALKKLSQTTFVQNLAAGNYSAVREAMPKRVQDAISQPPICDIEKIVGRGKIVIFIKAELIQLAGRISVSGNITPSQMEFIATQFVEMFPNESLADFKLCFERGCMGQYGEIFRMDGIVLRKWMEQYLSEKYEIIEQEVKAQRKSEQDADYTGPGYELFKKFADDLRAGLGKVPDMEQSEIDKNGKEKPARKETITAGYAWFDVRGVQIYAVTQEHAEELAALALKHGELEEF